MNTNLSQIWLYDEVNCPSGTCAGKVIRGHAEFRCSALNCHSFAVAAGGRLTADLQADLQADELVAVFREDQAGLIPWTPYTILKKRAGGSWFVGIGRHIRRTFSRRRSGKLALALDGDSARAARATFIGPWDFTLRSPNQIRLATRIAFDFQGVGLAQGWATGRAGIWEPVRQGRARLELGPDLMPCYWLRSRVRIKDLPKALRLYVDGEMPLDCFVNGVAVGSSTRAALWDRENRCFDIRALVRSGWNTLVLRIKLDENLRRSVSAGRTLTRPTVVMPVILAGDFKVFGPQTITRIAFPDRLPTGSWHAQGYPHYAGAADYEKEFTLPGDFRGQVGLELDNMRDVAMVVVNGKPLDTRVWEPYRFDLTPAVRPGLNQLKITVSNTLGNLLKRHYTGWDEATYPSGLIGPCRLVTQPAP